MTTFDNAYSRLVAWLKIGLPLAALAILSTLFLLSRTIDPAQTIPIANVDVQEMTREQRVGAPAFSGVLQDGAAVNLTADSAIPNQGDDGGLTAHNLAIQVESTGGNILNLSAPLGTMDNETNIAAFSGGLILDTSDGYHIETDGARADLNINQLETDGEILGSGPFGNFTAGKMIVTQQIAEDDTSLYVLVFMDGVKLVYTPPKQAGDE